MTPNDFIKTMLEELKAIAVGQSKHTNGAIQFDVKKLPFAAALDRFQVNPTPENLKEVVKIAEQDFGLRFGKFADATAEPLRVGYFKENPTPPPPPAPEVPFKQALYNDLTTILGRGREVAIDQRLLDLLYQDVNRLAANLDAEIKKQAQAEAKQIAQLAIQMLGQEIDKLQAQLTAVAETARQASINSAGGMRIG